MDASDHEEATDPNIFSDETDSKIVEKSALDFTMSETKEGSEKASSIAFAPSEACSTTKNIDSSAVCNVDMETGLSEASSPHFAASASRVTVESGNPESSKPCNLSVEAELKASSAAFSSSEGNLTVAAENTDGSKQCNLNVEAGSSKVLPKIHNETGLPGPSGEISSRLSVSENQLIANITRRKAGDCSDVANSGRMLLPTIVEAINVLLTNVHTFAERANAAQGQGNSVHYEYYSNLAAKYQDAVKDLKKRGEGVEAAVIRAEECASEACISADLLERLPDDASEEARLARFQACKWKNKAEEAIVVLLQKEHAALVTMKTIWLDVKKDVTEDNGSASDGSDGNLHPECYRFEARARKTDIAHVVAFFIGVSLLASTALFRLGSDSFNAVLALGLLITGWTIVYWIHKLYRYVRIRKKQNPVAATNEQTECEDGFIVNANSRLAIVEEMLRKHKAAPKTDSSSESGGSRETLRVGDSS